MSKCTDIILTHDLNGVRHRICVDAFKIVLIRDLGERDGSEIIIDVNVAMAGVGYATVDYNAIKAEFRDAAGGRYRVVESFDDVVKMKHDAIALKP